MSSLVLVWLEGDVEKAFADLATDDSEFTTWFRARRGDLRAQNAAIHPAFGGGAARRQVCGPCGSRHHWVVSIGARCLPAGLPVSSREIPSELPLGSATTG